MSIKKHWRLAVVVMIYLILATTHSLAVPLTTGNDEWAHFLYLRFIAENDHLPTTPAERVEAGYKSDAPPLYHLLVAAITAGVEPTRLLRPLDSPRRELADNLPDSYALVHAGVEVPPFQGEVLVWHLGRGVSILFGAVLILITYFTALEFFPRCDTRALLAAALIAFFPAFVFHSSVLSYESLSAVLTALFLWTAVKAVKQPGRWVWWGVLGVALGLSVTTKYSAILLPLEVVFVVWLGFRVAKKQQLGAGLSKRQRFWQYGVIPILLAGAAIILTAGWWFGFVIRYFNTIDTQGPVVGTLALLLVGDASDTTSVNVGLFLFGQDAVGTNARPLLERHYDEFVRRLLDSFWAAPVAGEFFGSPWLPVLFSLVAGLAVVGLGRVWRKNQGLSRAWLALLLFHALLIVPLLVVRTLLSFDAREVAQGRHILLPAASAIAILWVWGLAQWRYKISHAMVAGLLLWAVCGQVGGAIYAYPGPIPVWTQAHAPDREITYPVNQTFLDTIRLTGFNWQQIDNGLQVTLWWQALAENNEDYLIELSLRDEAGELLGYSVGHPAQGRYPTRSWEANDIVKDVHTLPLVDAPAGDYYLQLRLLDRQAVPVPDTTVSLGEITLNVSAQRNDDACAIWFQGRSQAGRLSERPYRLRESFVVIGENRPTLNPLPDRQDQTGQTPFISKEQFHVFVVGADWSDTYRLVVGPTMCQPVSFDLPPRQFTVPEISHPLDVNFNNQIKLLGYDLPARRIPPGGRLPLTLYWQALDTMGQDYRIFDNLLDRQQHRWGGYDRRARDGYSTLLWVPGEVITDAFGVPVDPDALAGVYTIDVGWYEQTEQGPESLPLVVDGQCTDQTSVRLGPVKVGGPPPEVVVADPAPQVVVEQSLGDQISLLGYDLVNQDKMLGLTLYWQAVATPPADYTTFVHLRDASNQNVAQKDSPPAGGRYPTGLWDSGEIIVDEILLPLENVAAGRYSLVVGLYNPATGERLPVPNHQANEILLEMIKLP